MKSIKDIESIIEEKNLIDGLIKSNGLYVLVAKPKAGKSLLALQLANSICNGISFLNMNTDKQPVFYISTELNEKQLKDRIIKTGYLFEDNQFFYSIKSNDNKLNIREDLYLDITSFAEDYNGKLVIIDMLSGIDYQIGYDLNNYMDIDKVISKYRELINKYNLSFLLIHHTNKNGSTLGSTGIEGFADGIFYLNDNGNNNYSFYSSSRDFPSFNINLKRNDNLSFEIVEEDDSKIDDNLITFIRYVIDKHEITFTPAEIVSQLKLFITPSKFGKILNENIDRLKFEGIYITKNRTSTSRNYTAKFIEPDDN